MRAGRKSCCSPLPCLPARSSAAARDSRPLAHLGGRPRIILCRLPARAQVVRTRLQTQALHGERGIGMVRTCRQILAAEGWTAFYRGLGASTLGLSHIAIQFPVYEASKASLTAMATRRRGVGMAGNHAGAGSVGGGGGNPGGGSSGGGGGGGGTSAGGSRARPSADAAVEVQHPTWVILVSSFASKLLASSATYPHELVRARLQDQRGSAHGEGRQYRGIIDAVSQTVRKEGVGALWHGFSVNLVRAVPQSMITFGLYEYLIWAL